MKATRRHDLKENALAKDIGKAGEFLKANGHWVVGGLLGLVVLIAVVLYAVDKRQKTRQNQWHSYFALASLVEGQRFGSPADSPNPPSKVRDELRKLASQTSQEALAGWASLLVGQSAYGQLSLMGPMLDPLAAEQLTREATDAFESVLATYGDRPHLTAGALLGLGRVAETNFQYDQAQAAYERASDLASTGAAGEAEQAVRLLKRLEGPRPMQKFPSAPPTATTDSEGSPAQPQDASAASSTPEMIAAPQAATDDSPPTLPGAAQ